MKLKQIIFSVITTAALFAGQSFAANSALNNWSASSVSSLGSSTVQQMSCDETNYSTVYVNNYGILLDYFYNSSNVPLYLWRYKIFNYGNHIVYNSSNYPGKDSGVLIFNRNKLASHNWKINPYQTVRHLTTAEEVGSPAYFNFNWSFYSPYTSTVSNSYGNFSFYKPNYRNPGSHPTTPALGSNYDAETRMLTFFDSDNNEGTTSDNKGVVECQRYQIRWCGDGILATAYGEQCDNGLANGTQGNSCSATCQNVPVPLPPDVTVQKSVTGSKIQGQNVTYTLTSRNIGSGLANNVVVTDTLGTGLTFIPSSSTPTPSSVILNGNGTTTITWNLGNMPANSIQYIKFDAQIKTSVPNCSTVKNQVQIAASNEPYQFTFNNDAMVTSPIQCPQNPQLWLQKDVVASTGGYMPNGYAVYTITYGNSGSGTATGTFVTDTLPSDVTFANSLPSPSSINGQTLTWNVGNLAPNQQGLIKIYVKINNNVPLCQNHTILNKGVVDATNAGPAEDDATFLILCYDLWSNKVIDKPVVASGDVVTYTIRYGNLGPLTAPNWSLFDNLPAGLQYLPNSVVIHSGVNIGQPTVTGTPSAGQKLTWTGFTNMPAGYSGLVSIKATVLGPVASGHIYVNKVCIEGDNYYNNNNCGEATTTTTGFGGTPFFDVNIKKTVDKTIVKYGDTVTYTIVVTNEADATSPITGYTVRDYLPAGVDYVNTTGGPGGIVTTLSGTKEIIFSGLPALKPGDSITITFTATYKSTVNEINYTEVCTYNGVSGTGVKDRDSNPCNRGRNHRVEDDEDQVTIGPDTGPPGQSPECQGLSGNPDVTNLITSASQVSVEYECRTTWGAYPVDAVLQCGNGQVFTGTTINSTPFKATCTYSNPTNTKAVCVVARRPNPACEKPVAIRPGGGGHRPYCGDGIFQPDRGEQCDPGNPLLGIKPAGVPAGKVCRPDCTFGDRPSGITVGVQCSYIDPPSINVGEYMPYRWDMEYGYYRPGGAGYGQATSACTSNTGDVRINIDSLDCEFSLNGPNGASKTWVQKCYSNPNLPLINTAFSSAKIKYDLPNPGGLGAVQITGSYYLGLGEYRLEMRVINGRLCNGNALTLGDRICQMNFGVTKQYAVSRTPTGTSSSTKDLDDYKRQDNTKVLQVNELIKVLDSFALSNADTNLIAQMVNKYVTLAVKVDTIDDKLDNNTTVTKAGVSKVPGKNIFVIDAKTPDGKRGTITVLENATFSKGAFTLIVINGNLTVKGDLTKNPNGMFIVRDGDLTFSAIGNAQENNQNQTVKGIFIGLQNVKAEGDGYQAAFNNDLNKPWINGGRLLIHGVILGGNLKELVEGRRSIVESWFDKRAGDGLLDDGALVIKANPEIFTNLPPGAEDISLTLNIFKQ